MERQCWKWKKTKSERKRWDQGEKQSERGRSSRRGVKGVITPAGWVAERASESRRMAPRRVVRLGYQMVRTSSRCTIRLYYRSRGTSRECNGGIRAVSYAAVAARLHTTLVSPNYLVLVVRSGDRKLTARAENIDRPRPERSAM